MDIHKNTEHSCIFWIVPLQNPKFKIKKLNPEQYLNSKNPLASIFNGVVPLECTYKFSDKIPMVKQAN